MAAGMAQSDEMVLALGKKNEADKGLIVEFYRKPKQDEAASAEAGRPIFVEKPYVRIITPGDIINKIDRPVWDEPGNENCDTVRFAEKWARFKAGIAEEKSGTGTPLEKLPGILSTQVEEMKYFNVRTIEQLADLDDSHGQRFMGIQQLKQRAKTWLEAAKGNAPLEKMRTELEKRDQMIADLMARVAAMEKPAPGASVAQLQEQAAQLSALEAKGELEQHTRGKQKAK